MDRRRALLASLLLAACGSDPETRKPDGDADPRISAAWFAIKTTDCEASLPAVARAATRPGTRAPMPHRMAAGATWCTLTPASEPGSMKGPVRSDAVAQAVSGAVKLPTIAFWTTDRAWSYAVFENGEPLYAMESHYGSPMLIGDEARAAALIGLPAGALYGYLVSAKQPAAADALAARIGASRPGSDAVLATLIAPDAPPPGRETFDPRMHLPSPRLDAGAWAVLPPMGVVLVKEVTADGNYVLVDEDKTFPIPIARAGGLGMRRLASAEEAGRALKVVEVGAEVENAREYSAERAQRWLDRLKVGDLQGIALTYAELCAVESERKLYAVELGLLATSREWLSEEIGTVQSRTADVVEEELIDFCD